jgi:hypothetical protein
MLYDYARQLCLPYAPLPDQLTQRAPQVWRRGGPDVNPLAAMSYYLREK